MTDNAKNSARRAYEIMKTKGYTPEEIEAFLDYLEQSTKEITQPMVERIEKLETRFRYGFWALAVLILAAPGLLQDIIKGTFGL